MGFSRHMLSYALEIRLGCAVACLVPVGLVFCAFMLVFFFVLDFFYFEGMGCSSGVLDMVYYFM